MTFVVSTALRKRRRSYREPNQPGAAVHREKFTKIMEKYQNRQVEIREGMDRKHFKEKDSSLFLLILAKGTFSNMISFKSLAFGAST